VINIQAALLVSLAAFIVTPLVVTVAARLSQQQTKDKLMAKIKEYSELSSDASNAGVRNMYAALQKQGNEVLMQYYVVLYREAVVELALHVLVLGIIQNYYPVHVLNFSIQVWGLGDGLSSVGWYIISAILVFQLLVKPLKPKLRFFRPGWV